MKSSGELWCQQPPPAVCKASVWCCRCEWQQPLEQFQASFCTWCFASSLFCFVVSGKENLEGWRTAAEAENLPLSERNG